MPRSWIWPLRHASVGLIGIYSIACAATAMAGGNGSDEDPIGRRYFTGAVPMNAVVARKFPEEPAYYGFLPRSVDLSANLPAPGDQGELGSCTAWAVGYAARSYYVKALEKRTLTAQNIPSPGFLYNQARRADCDRGTSIDENVRVLQQGALSLSEYPNTSQCAKPSSEQIARAIDFKVTGFHRIAVKNIEDVKGQIAKGNPVVVSLKVDSTFQKFRGPGIFAQKVVSADADNHAMLAVGYDEKRQAFRLINSWGTGWGDRGFMWIGYDTFQRLAFEAAVLDVPAGKTVIDVPPVPVSDLVDQINAKSCGQLAITHDNAVDVVSGYVGSEAELKALTDIVARYASARIGDVVALPWPQCELKKILADVTNENDSPAISLQAGPAYKQGDQLSFSVTAPDHFSSLYVAYLQADQTVVQLGRHKNAQLDMLNPKQIVAFGDGRDGRSKLEIGPPYGHELLVAIATRSPLFDASVPKTLSARDFLSQLRKALIYKPKADLADRIISHAVVAITTEERKK